MVSGSDSPCGVFTVTGLFIIGITLLISGTIVLYQHQHGAFVVAACIFLVVGAAMLTFCGFLQRNEIRDYLSDLHQDNYFNKHQKKFTGS